VDINQLLGKAISAALLAGEEILKVYNTGFEVEQKADNSPLTIADKNAHNAICDQLKSLPYPILSEEGRSIDFNERKDWEYFWMVDPLDGTKEFVKRNGEFTVNIALIHEQQSILGVIYIPVTRVLYFAAQGIGCFKITLVQNDTFTANLEELINQSQKLPIKQSPRKFTVVASRSHLSEETQMFVDGLQTTHKDIEFISTGSSIKLCLVAEGAADIYPRFAPTMEWDTAAGQAICEIAGKTVIDYQTNAPLLYNKENLLNNWFIVK
jgi:3'(2'), 5'-bisphosphate nucleotidase